MSEQYSEWSTIDAGGVGTGESYDIVDGRPPEPILSVPFLFYPSLDPDAPENKLNDVSPFSKLWYSQLPTHMKEADQHQNAETGAWPMLRFMETIGHIADGVRSTVDDMYQGVWTHPSTVPDRGLLWLAALLGVPESQKNVSRPQLREALVDMVENGRKPVGTPAELAAAAKQFLTGNKRVSVYAAAQWPGFFTPTDEALIAAMGFGSVTALHVQPVAPLPAVDNRWTGTPHASISEQYRRGQFHAENLVWNPSFETNLTGWTTPNATLAQDTVVVETGTASGRITPGTAGWGLTEAARDVPGTGTLVARYRVRCDTAKSVRARIVSGTATTYGETIALNAGEWTWVHVSADVTVGNTYAISLLNVGTDTHVVYVDRVYAARSQYAVGGYFDGDGLDSASTEIWLDTDIAVAHTWDGNAWTAYAGVEVQAQAVIDERLAGDMLRAHTIVIVAAPNEIPNADLEAFAASMRSVGVVPGGHSLQVMTLQPNWDAADAAIDEMGGSWDAYERGTATWADDEALGLDDFTM